MGADQRGDLGREGHLEPAIADPPGHRVAGPGDRGPNRSPGRRQGPAPTSSAGARRRPRRRRRRGRWGSTGRRPSRKRNAGCTARPRRARRGTPARPRRRPGRPAGRSSAPWHPMKPTWVRCDRRVEPQRLDQARGRNPGAANPVHETVTRCVIESAATPRPLQRLGRRSTGQRRDDLLIAPPSSSPSTARPRRLDGVGDVVPLRRGSRRAGARSRSGRRGRPGGRPASGRGRRSGWSAPRRGAARPRHGGTAVPRPRMARPFNRPPVAHRRIDHRPGRSETEAVGRQIRMGSAIPDARDRARARAGPVRECMGIEPTGDLSPGRPTVLKTVAGTSRTRTPRDSDGLRRSRVGDSVGSVAPSRTAKKPNVRSVMVNVPERTFFPSVQRKASYSCSVRGNSIRTGPSAGVSAETLPVTG